MFESFHARRGAIISTVSGLATLADEVGAETLAAKIRDEILQNLAEDAFHLVVVGEFNHGKTTFVNALLGASILPVGVTPTTAVIHHVGYGDPPSASVVDVHGVRSEVTFADIQAFAVGKGARPPGEVKYVDVRVPSALLKERIVLVDTPGVNDLSKQRADITYSYIPKSDAVLFLLDAGQPLKESERAFLQEKLLAQSRSRIFFVVTKRDIWSPSEEAEALAYIRTQLGKWVEAPALFPVSAERSLAHSGPQPDLSGMPELVSHLSRFLADERGPVLLSNALDRAEAASAMLLRGVDAKRRSAQMSQEELTRRIELLERDLEGHAVTTAERRAKLREEIAAIRAWVGRDLAHLVADVERQIPAVIDDAKPNEIRDHLGPFLESTIVAWVKKETDEIAVALEGVAERTVALVAADASDSAARLSDAFGHEVKAPSIKIDAFGHNVGITALVVVGLGVMFSNVLLGGSLAVLSLPLAWYLRGREERLTRDRAREIAPQVVREAAEQLRPKLEGLINDFADALDEWVRHAGVELHTELREVLKKALAGRAFGAAATEQVLQQTEVQSASLGRLTAELRSLREPRASEGAVAEAQPPAPIENESSSSTGESV